MASPSSIIPIGGVRARHGNMRDSADFIEGPKAFAEKRPPNWQGV